MTLHPSLTMPALPVSFPFHINSYEPLDAYIVLPNVDFPVVASLMITSDVAQAEALNAQIRMPVKIPYLRLRGETNVRWLFAFDIDGNVCGGIAFTLDVHGADPLTEDEVEYGIPEDNPALSLRLVEIVHSRPRKWCQLLTAMLVSMTEDVILKIALRKRRKHLTLDLHFVAEACNEAAYRLGYSMEDALRTVHETALDTCTTDTLSIGEYLTEITD